jgi:adenylate cyclase
MEFPINTTVAEILNALSGVDAPGKKATTNMKLYLRTGGQGEVYAASQLTPDRQLLPSEKPLAIQDRRLRQAGYTDLERLEELGKEDLFILCKFIHQTPNLPVMNPVRTPRHVPL